MIFFINIFLLHIIFNIINFRIPTLVIVFFHLILVFIAFSQLFWRIDKVFVHFIMFLLQSYVFSPKKFNLILFLSNCSC